MSRTIRRKKVEKRNGKITTYRVIEGFPFGALIQFQAPGKKSYTTIQAYATVEDALKRLEEIK